MHEKDGNIMNDDDNLPLERQSSHVSACADQSQNHACSQQCLDKDASVSRGESRDVSSAGEYGIPDRATTSMREIQTMSNPFIENSDLEIDLLFDKMFDDAEPKNNSLMTEVTPDAESKVDSPEMRDGVAEFEAGDIESGMGDTEIIRYPLKRKARTGGQGSQGGCNNFGRHLHV